MQWKQTLQNHWTGHWNQWKRLKTKFVLSGWIENPIKSKVLTFPIDKIVFPTVTLCPQDSRPDRWGTVIKIFDQLNSDCGSKRWHFCSIQLDYSELSSRIWETQWMEDDNSFSLPKKKIFSQDIFNILKELKLLKKQPITQIKTLDFRS